MHSQGKALTLLFPAGEETSKTVSKMERQFWFQTVGSAVSFSSCGSGNKWCIKFHLLLD